MPLQIGKSLRSVLAQLGIRAELSAEDALRLVVIADDLSITAEPPSAPWFLCSEQLSGIVGAAGVIQLAPRDNAIRVMSVNSAVSVGNRRLALFATDQRTNTTVSDVVAPGSLDPPPTVRIQVGSRVAAATTNHWEIVSIGNAWMFPPHGIVVRPGEFLASIGSAQNDLNFTGFFGYEIPARTTPAAI